MSELRVCAKRCEECLFSNARIVSAERARDIQAECEAEDKHFICHKSGTVGGPERMCRGSYDQNPRVVRFAKAMRIPIVMVDPQTGESV